jgi:hypothetical protein
VYGNVIRKTRVIGIKIGQPGKITAKQSLK